MKIASRYLLPVEMLTGIFLVSWGLSGWLGGGALGRMLRADGFDDEWGIVLCGIGGAQFVLAALEGLCGRQWPERWVFYSVTARCCLAFFACALWVWVTYMMVTLRGPGALLTLALQAPACMGASIWVFWGNRKVAYVLDPLTPTDRLEREIMKERDRRIRGH